LNKKEAEIKTNYKNKHKTAFKPEDPKVTHNTVAPDYSKMRKSTPAKPREVKILNINIDACINGSPLVGSGDKGEKKEKELDKENLY